MKRPIPNGFLIAVEGIDGAGKTSIATLLAQWCGERGLGCVLSKEPTSNKWGRKLRESASSGRLSLEEELELLYRDRKEHVENSIRPALDEGNVVILDRYYWSSAAYQGGRGEKDYREIVEENERFAPVPDLFIVLDLEPTQGLERIKTRGDKPNHFEGKATLSKGRQIFSQLVEQHPAGVLVDSSGTLKQAYESVFDAFIIRAMNKISSAGLSVEVAHDFMDLVGGTAVLDRLVQGAVGEGKESFWS